MPTTKMRDAEEAVIAALESKQESEKMSRVAHLPFLLRKMRSTKRYRESMSETSSHSSRYNIFSDSEAFRMDTKSARGRSASPMVSERHVSATSTTPPIMNTNSSSKRTSNATKTSNTTTTTSTTQEQFKATQLVPDGAAKTDKDAFLDNAIHLQTLMEVTEDDDSSLSSTEEEEGSDDLLDTEATTLLNKRKSKKKKKKKRNKNSFSRIVNHLTLLLEPEKIQAAILRFLKIDLLLLDLPLLITAFILFYVLGNPDLEMLPNTATLAWYLIFIVRLHLTFTLARCSQWVLELVTVRTGFLAQWSGPLIAIFAMQSIGFPFLLTSWGAWNSVVLHGTHPFNKHWLDFTNIAIFTVENNPDGDGILQSDLYGRILFAMIFVGLATAIKRTTVALFLSKRMLQNYKPQLEQLMQQVKLITGIAELAAETERPGFAELIADAAEDDQSIATTASQIHQWSSSDFMDAVPTFEDGQQQQQQPAFQGTTATTKEREEKWRELKAELVAEDKTTPSTSTQLPSAKVPMIVDSSNHGGSTFERVFSSLDHYDPPEDQETKHESPSLSDVLQFRKAMNFMRLGYPFSPLFGRADTRERCVQSAIQVYNKLQKFLPPDDDTDEDQLSFDVLGAIAYKEDGTLDKANAQGLLRLFLPDKDNQVSLQAFVQALDSVYKQILFLGASMSNTSKIDSVLEEGFNVGFYGVLSIIVLSLVGWNPWPLLASFGTMLLSLTFALGPSCAKTIEGILAIAVRRPFDLGDRVSLTTGSAGSSPNQSDTWIVEDINLMTTTLRYAATNEVSTINNSSLSEAQIVNCARSPKAVVRFRMAFRVEATSEKLQAFRSHLVAYLQDHPQTWAGLIQFANDGIQRDDGYIVYMIGVQHVKSWQDLGKIVANRGELEVEADRIAQELEIFYDSPAGKMNVELVQKKTDVC